MDQPISCQDVYHIYKHPLSILIHLKYQDKDGCSKNGSRELLFNLRLENGGEIDRLMRSSILDSRGIPIDLGEQCVSCFDSDDERIILGFRQLNLNINSQFPIVQEEREAMTYLLRSTPNLMSQDNHEIFDILDNPTLGNQSINSVCGHVIGIYSHIYFPLKFTSSNHSQLLSLLTQFQHLRSLRFGIFGNWEHQEQFYEELGDQLGSKLVHLGIRSTFRTNTLELLSNQMFKFSTLKKLKLDINSRDFNPSFGISSHLIIYLLITCRWYFHVNSIG